MNFPKTGVFSKRVTGKYSTITKGQNAKQYVNTTNHTPERGKHMRNQNPWETYVILYIYTVGRNELLHQLIERLWNKLCTNLCCMSWRCPHNVVA